MMYDNLFSCAVGENIYLLTYLLTSTGGGALWRACNIPAFTSHLTGPVDYLFASCHEGPGFNPQGVPM